MRQKKNSSRQVAPKKEIVLNANERNPLADLKAPSDPQIMECLKGLPEGEKQTVAQILSMVRAESFSGPIPHPDILAKYNELVPGSADRLIGSYEKEQNHRHGCEDKIVGAETFSVKFGMISAVGIAIICLAVVIVLAMLDSDPWVQGTVSLAMVSLVGVLVTRKPPKNSNPPQP